MKLSAWHQMLPRDSYRCCHGIRTATACRTLRVAASLRTYLAIDCRSNAQAPASITKAMLIWHDWTRPLFFTGLRLYVTYTLD